jgi:hypothetical protein
MTVGPNDNPQINNRMVLTMRDGVPVEKEWTGPQSAKPVVGPFR